MKKLLFFPMYNKRRWSHGTDLMFTVPHFFQSRRQKKTSKRKYFAAYTKDTLLMHLLPLPVEGVCSFIFWSKHSKWL